jgi:hypothetical protein
MLSRRALFCGLLFVAASLSVLGQESERRYEALKQALRLSDAQMFQLQQMSLAPIVLPAPTASPGVTGIYQPAPAARSPLAAINQRTRSADSLQVRILDDSQRTKLAAIEKVLDRWQAATLAIGLGLIREQQWPGGTALCLPNAIRAYASYAAELGLTPSQIEQFEQIRRDASAPLWAQVREKVMQRSDLLNSGVGADSPAAVQLGSDIDKLQAQVSARPQHDLALAMLDATQKAKLAAFETELQAVSEAIELRLIPAPVGGEPLCP